MINNIQDTIYEWKDQFNEATDVRCLGWKYIGESDYDYDGRTLQMWHRLILPNSDVMLMDHEWGPREVPTKSECEGVIHAFLERLGDNNSIV
tara:strand:- start:110 stop:385 length:276 start_codon:yes stop_codon:yes gene_type:complete